MYAAHGPHDLRTVSRNTPFTLFNDSAVQAPVPPPVSPVQPVVDDIDHALLNWHHPRLAKSLSMEEFRDLAITFNGFDAINRAVSLDDRDFHRKNVLESLSTGESLCQYPAYNPTPQWGHHGSLDMILNMMGDLNEDFLSGN